MQDQLMNRKQPFRREAGAGRLVSLDEGRGADRGFLSRVRRAQNSVRADGQCCSIGEVKANSGVNVFSFGNIERKPTVLSLS
jgi:hypothetical protein